MVVALIKADRRAPSIPKPGAKRDFNPIGNTTYPSLLITYIPINAHRFYPHSVTRLIFSGAMRREIERIPEIIAWILHMAM